MGKVERLPIFGETASVAVGFGAMDCDRPVFVPSAAAMTAAGAAYDRCRTAGAAPHYAFLAATEAFWDHHPDLDDAEVHEAVADLLAR